MKTLVVLIILLMISILITAIPFLRTCKKYGMGFAVKRFFAIWGITFLILILISSGILINEITKSHRRSMTMIDECNYMITSVKER